MTQVAILAHWAEIPVFHLVGEFERLDLPDDRRGWKWATVCGIVLESWSFQPGVDCSYSKRDRPHIVLRRDHAEKFGRLCQRCEAST